MAAAVSHVALHQHRAHSRKLGGRAPVLRRKPCAAWSPACRRACARAGSWAPAARAAATGRWPSARRRRLPCARRRRRGRPCPQQPGDKQSLVRYEGMCTGRMANTDKPPEKLRLFTSYNGCRTGNLASSWGEVGLCNCGYAGLFGDLHVTLSGSSTTVVCLPRTRGAKGPPRKSTWPPGRPCCCGSIDCDVVRARSPGVVGRLACCESGLAASIIVGTGCWATPPPCCWWCAIIARCACWCCSCWCWCCSCACCCRLLCTCA